jgi:hypothetical protein
MNKIMEGITVSAQIFPTATTAKSGSATVDMLNYHKAVAKLFAHRLPDAKGEGVITLSLYENAATGLTGTVVSAGVVTGSITSASDVFLETEIAAADLSKRYIYAYVQSNTSTNVVATITRGEPRYEPV